MYIISKEFCRASSLGRLVVIYISSVTLVIVWPTSIIKLSVSLSSAKVPLSLYSSLYWVNCQSLSLPCKMGIPSLQLFDELITWIILLFLWYFVCSRSVQIMLLKTFTLHFIKILLHWCLKLPQNLSNSMQFFHNIWSQLLYNLFVMIHLGPLGHDANR